MKKSNYLALGLLALTLAMSACKNEAAATLDQQLRAVIARENITPIDAGPAQSAAKVELGQALMFDKMLSGNGDISCATCHHPSHALGDGLSVPIGTGGEGLGDGRALVDGHLIPRNAPEVFNRGSIEWSSMFWDSRVSIDPVSGNIRTPAAMATPPGLDSVLAAQALFPVASRDEMLGFADNGSDANDLAECPDNNFGCVWNGLVARIGAIPDYVDLFMAAYPAEVSDAGDINITHVVNSIAAFEADAWSFFDTPWDDFVAGDDEALTDEAKRGALLFFGRARCSVCHRGVLFTDQLHHNIGVPQIGPGKGDGATINGQTDDFGLAHETGRPQDMYRFRTPPLRNVAATAPYEHDGAYSSLRDAVRHYDTPQAALDRYSIAQSGDSNIAALGARDDNDVNWRQGVLANLDPIFDQPVRLNNRDLDELVAFLASLTSPTLFNLDDTIPASVPSGCPVDEDSGPCDGSVLD